MTMSSGPRRRSRSAKGALHGMGRLMAERRFALNLTQAELADLAGVGVSSVRTLEAGLATVTLQITLDVLDALGLAAAVGPRSTFMSSADVALLNLGEPT